MRQKDILIDYALKYLGAKYDWGSNGPETFDCSGFVQWCLRVVGKDFIGDQTAQGLHDKMKLMYEKGDDILFFGKTRNDITHVALGVGGGLMIEAGGAGVQSNDIGCVRVVPIRKDLVHGYNLRLL